MVTLEDPEGCSPLVWTPGVTGRRRAAAMSMDGAAVGAAVVRLARAAARPRRDR